MGEGGIGPLLFTPNFLYIAKNIRKEAVSTFFARVMLTGGLEPPFYTMLTLFNWHSRYRTCDILINSQAFYH